MRLLLDENLSPRLVLLLATEYPDSQHVSQIGLARADDAAVWAYAAAHGLIIASKDSDFQHRALLYGPPPKVVLLRVGNGSTGVVARLLKDELASMQAFANDNDAAILVLSRTSAIRPK